MDPEQVWQSVVSQLQAEMPRASFDTWVRDTNFVSCAAGIFTIATRNRYACDWLQNRLTETVSGLLTEILNQPVKVNFVVTGEEIVPVNAEAASEADADESETASETASSVIRARVSLSEYEQIVKPGRKIVFPAYFLRHITRMGPELAWIVIALRQLVFLSHDAKPIPGREIARWAGMSRRAFWRWSKRLGTIPEFVDRHPEIVDGQRVIAYTVWADDSCPLTPADAQSLAAALTKLLAQHGSPHQAANALIEMTSAEIRTQILPLEPNLFENVSGEAVTVNELVQWLGWPPELGLRLSKRIMDAFGLTILTWHFVLQLLSRLDHGPAWMITILRDQCYDGRDQRSSTMLTPATLAKLCGLKGKWLNNTLSDWLRKELVQSMVVDANLGDRSLGADRAHCYHVSFFDPILSETDNPKTPSKPVAPVLSNNDFNGSRESGIGVEGKRHKGRGEVTQPSRASGTGVEGKWHNDRGQVAQGSRESGTTLNLFNPLNQALLNPLTSTNQAATLHIRLDNTTSRSVGGRQSWVLSEILRECKINPKKREQLLLNVSAADFLATLIYAHSPWGDSIENPVSFTIAHVLDPERYQKLERKREKQYIAHETRAQAHVRPEKRIRDPDDEAFRILACLPPDELAHLLEQQYAAGQPESKTSPPELPAWVDSGLDRLVPQAVQALAAMLGEICF